MRLPITSGVARVGGRQLRVSPLYFLLKNLAAFFCLSLTLLISLGYHPGRPPPRSDYTAYNLPDTGILHHF